MKRGSGTTTRAMQNAPKDSVYIWCNSQLVYPKALAHKLLRDDLIIVSPSWLDGDQWRGIKLNGLRLDHAAELNESQWERYYMIADYNNCWIVS